MEALKLTRKDYNQGLENLAKGFVNNDENYLSLFEVEFPDGINTTNSIEICRVIMDSSLDAKIHLMKICIAGKNVKVKCPNGDIEKFCISNPNDSLEGFPLFKKEPLAIKAISDNIYGYLLKKYIRLPQAQATAKE
jgi:hypothetical protein